MITRTFSFITGITGYRERYLKEKGIKCWDDFLSKDYIQGISCRKKDEFDKYILKAKINLECMNFPFFYDNLPKNEQWRLYERFKKYCAFLDIETTGLNQSRNMITAISVFDGRRTKTFINGINLKSRALNDYMRRYKMIVTFNGSMFDLPFIKKHFPGVNLNMPHMDLRWVGRKIGLTGGLKAIEKNVGIRRGDDIKDITGLDAIRLWKRWERNNDKEALDTLVKYNQEDVINLKTLADYVYNVLATPFKEKV